MALLWIEGFEGYGTTTGTDITTLVLARGYVGTSGLRLATGRISGYSLFYNSAGTGATVKTPPLTTDPTLIVGCAFYFPGTQFTAGIYLYYNAVLGINVIFDPATASTITVKLGNTTLAIYSGFTTLFNTNVWYYLEVKVYCHASAGTVEVRLNGTTIMSGGALSGINTQAGAEAYYNVVSLWTSLYSHIDDIYICDGSGSIANDFQGVCRVLGIFPNADTATEQWTPNSGAVHYDRVAENPPDGATTYVSSSTQAQIDLYYYPALVGASTIVGIQINSQVILQAGTSVIIESPIVSNSVIDLGPDVQVYWTAAYADTRHISMTDPNTDAPWTIANLAAAQIGVQVM